MVWPAVDALPEDAGADAVSVAEAEHPTSASEAARATVAILSRTLSPF